MANEERKGNSIRVSFLPHLLFQAPRLTVIAKYSPASTFAQSDPLNHLKTLVLSPSKETHLCQGNEPSAITIPSHTYTFRARNGHIWPRYTAFIKRFEEKVRYLGSAWQCLGHVRRQCF